MKITKKQEELIQTDIYMAIDSSEITSDPMEKTNLANDLYEVLRQLIEESGEF
jgi:hypothetical protein